MFEDFVNLTALDELHTEVALTVALADFVNGNDAWMFQARRRFRLTPKALQMRFSGPRTKADHLQRNDAIETFLMGPINYALTTPPNFLQQLVIAKLTENFCPPRDGLAVASRARSFFSV